MQIRAYSRYARKGANAVLRALRLKKPDKPKAKAKAKPKPKAKPKAKALTSVEREALFQFEAGRPEEAIRVLDTAGAGTASEYMIRAKIALYAEDQEAAQSWAVRAMTASSLGDKTYLTAFFMRLEALRSAGRHQDCIDSLKLASFPGSRADYFRALRLSIVSEADVATFENRLVTMPLSETDMQWALFHYSLLLRNFGDVARAQAVVRDRFVRLTRTSAFGSKGAASIAPKVGVAGWDDNSATALRDLKTIFDAADIEMFLVSGTALGCYRDGQILPHDKDIDVGVDERYDLSAVAEVIRRSPMFRLREVTSDRTLYVVHANGVMIDVFQHYMEDGRYWHEGLKVRWWNMPFGLREVDFLGQRHLLPDDTDKYLTENYGDWRTPNKDFETFTDTPNMAISAPGVLTWYYLSRMYDYYRAGKRAQFERVVKAYIASTGDLAILDGVSWAPTDEEFAARIAARQAAELLAAPDAATEDATDELGERTDEADEIATLSDDRDNGVDRADEPEETVGRDDDGDDRSDDRRQTRRTRPDDDAQAVSADADA